ncbi:GGDEF domain-containing protein [Roseateles microcysteis]|uniref:GGDEF domain-containing protein n=1 Tax=Roseateles microcysteis TaxID=3119057 RepID=UPI002FE692FE
MEAVKTRLRLQAGQRPHTDDHAEAVRYLRQQMLTCAVALDQLQSGLAGHLAEQRLLAQQALHSMQLELEQAQAELAGTQAGERRARHMALHDTLTGLPNRRYFRQRLELALRHDEGTPPPGMAVLFMDLDGFKAINDNHGHQIGDELLRVVASRLSRVVRQGDMISRIGGDEFACLRLDWHSRGQLIQLAVKLHEVVAAPLTLGILKLSIKPSIGISLCPADGQTVTDLLKAADLAMYHAKQQHSGHAFFDQSAAR